MMIAMDDYQTMKRAIDKAHADYQQKRGQRRQLLQDLKANFGVEGLKAAKKLHERLKRRELQAYKIWIRAKREFKRKYPKIFRPGKE